MYEIVNDLNHEIFKEKKGPFISLYQKTHKNVSENAQDLIRFKNTLKQIEKELEPFDKTVKASIIENLYELRDDKPFWNQTLEAIAVFISQEQMVVYNLRRPVKDLLVINDYFHRKPLINHFQTLDEYYILALSKENFELYEGTIDDIHRIPLEDRVPTTKEEVLGKLDDESYLAHASYGGASGNAMYHGHHDKKQVFEKDLQRFFIYIDQFIMKEFTNATKRPVILCALPEYHGLFKQISKNKYLYSNGIKRSNKDLTVEQLREASWEVLKDDYHERIDHLIEQYRNAQTKKIGSNILSDVASSAATARIDTLIVEQAKFIEGTMDPESGKLNLTHSTNHSTGNILDEIAHHVLENGGKVFVVNEEQMPSDTGVAAIYRY